MRDGRSAVKHPTKPELTAVSVRPVLPDFECWCRPLRCLRPIADLSDLYQPPRRVLLRPAAGSAAAAFCTLAAP